MSRGYGKTQRKILLLILGGVALGLSGSPKRYFKIVNAIKDEWKEIDTRNGKRAIRTLRERGLLAEKKMRDGTVKIVLTRSGRRTAEGIQISSLKTRIPEKWDGKWRIVLFDIPENRRGGRDSLRHYLRRFGFLELQKSVFVYPYDVWKELQQITNLLEIKKHVRFAVVDSIDNEQHLQKEFGI